MIKYIKILISLLIFIFYSAKTLADDDKFKIWLNNFKNEAINMGISEEIVTSSLANARFLPKVIEYDRYQPEFYEDTKTYIKKRTSKDKLRKGLVLYKREKKTINTVEKNFFVEKELLLVLMGKETNFGKYLGKMDIISSLATLSFDKRRSAFFKNELLTLLSLLDRQIITKEELYGSWAGAF